MQARQELPSQVPTKSAAAKKTAVAPQPPVLEPDEAPVQDVAGLSEPAAAYEPIPSAAEEAAAAAIALADRVPALKEHP